MPALHTRSVTWITAGLALLMTATRFHHAGSALTLPDASLAVFFLVGWYQRSSTAFAGFLLAAFAIDYVAIAYAGVSSYCVSPAYGFLVPAYAAMWFAGRRAALWPRPAWSTTFRCFLALLASTTAAYLITEISFFLVSGRQSGTDWISYGAGMVDYYPGYLAGTFVYCALALCLDGLAGLGDVAAGYQPKPK